MDKVVNEGVKNMQWCGQNEHWKQANEQKQIYILQQSNLHWYIKNISNSTNKIIVCVYVCVCVCV